MKLKFTIVIVALSSVISYAQQNDLGIFKKLTGKTWVAEGNWGDGSKFKQEITYKYSLDSSIVIANSKGFTDLKQTKYGLRNHGIRQFDKNDKKLKFWEFDVFGGLTTGEINVEGDNLFYTYNYGGSLITDAWIQQDDNSYLFIVGSRKDGKWTQKYLETKFVASDLKK